MRTKPLGRDGSEISVVGFGAWEAGKSEEWGEPPPDEQIVAAIDRALAAPRPGAR